MVSSDRAASSIAFPLSLSFDVASYRCIVRQSAGLPRWEIQQDQAGDGDGNTEAGEKPDRFSGEQSPEETPERKQVRNCGHMGGGNLGEQAVVEQVGEAASSEAEHSNGDNRSQTQRGRMRAGNSERQDHESGERKLGGREANRIEPL